jgi:hypothetical protein
MADGRASSGAERYKPQFGTAVNRRRAKSRGDYCLSAGRQYPQTMLYVTNHTVTAAKLTRWMIFD